MKNKLEKCPIVKIAEKLSAGFIVQFRFEKGLELTAEKCVIGLEKKPEDKIQLREVFAKAAKQLKQYEKHQYIMDISPFIQSMGVDCVREAVEGIILGLYEQRLYPSKETEEIRIELYGVDSQDLEHACRLLEESINVVEGIVFARDMVNMPGNKLRPHDFAAEIISLMESTDVQTELIDLEQLQTMKMGGLLGVGESSEFPPCLLILRYKNNPDSIEVNGLVGKGVTCDTGGYCLKPAASMLGIKGDMAGGAAVAGAIYALAANHVKTNAVGVIPICENRISPGSLLPGDVITSYSGKTIEICNTDAEGRLILADAVSYAVAKEGATSILDIATLTGAVVSMFGFSIGGVISDDDALFDDFHVAYEEAGERYWRIPFYNEHEKMIESKIADIKNVGEGCCGTITAGLFIRTFAEKKPWIHLDIAGSAWVDTPVYEYQSKGATGAGVTAIYHLCSRRGK